MLGRIDAELDRSKKSHRIFDETLTVIEVDFKDCVDVLNEISPEIPVLLDKLLYNIGLDASNSDLVMLVPGGMNIRIREDETGENGIAPNEKLPLKELVKYLNRQYSIAFILPTFSATSSLTDVEKLNENAGIDTLSFRPLIYEP